MENVFFNIARSFAVVDNNFKLQRKFNNLTVVYLCGLITCTYITHAKVKVLEKKVKELERLNSIDKED